MNIKRLNYIDVAKGIGMLLVVIGHCSNTIANKYIYSFHMPLFFIITGILYRIHYDQTKMITINIKKKFCSLMIPYVIWGFVYESFSTALGFIAGNNLHELIVKNTTSYIALDASVYWFLPCMFISSIIFLYIRKFKYADILYFIIYLLGALAANTSMLIEPFLQAFIAVGFIEIGWVLYIFFTSKHSILTIILAFCTWCICAQNNGGVGIAGRITNNLILFTLAATFGTFVIIQISIKIAESWKKHNLIQFWGVNSMIILCIHMFVIEIISCINSAIFNNIIERIGFNYEFSIIILVTCATTILIIIWNLLSHRGL